MEKATIFLVQKSSLGAVDQEKAGPIKPRHSVSLELLDGGGDNIVDEACPNDPTDEGSGVVNRKRSRGAGEPLF